MRLLSATIVAAATGLVLATPAGAGLWLDLDRALARPGENVHAQAVTSCGACGPAPLYLVRVSKSGLQGMKSLPRGKSGFFTVGRFTWKQGGRFTFRLPQVRPGLYQLHAFYRNGSAWSAAPASTLLRVLASSPGPATKRVSFGSFSIVLPKAWYWRTLKGAGGRIVQLSNASLRLPRGHDPIKDMGPQSFVLTIAPLGTYGSRTAPTIARREFLARSDPSRPRDHALARHSYCSPGGRCFLIAMEYGRERVPESLLGSVNRVLRSLQAALLRS